MRFATMGSAGDSPAPVGDPPTGMERGPTRVRLGQRMFFPFRPASRRTAQASRLYYHDHASSEGLGAFQIDRIVQSDERLEWSAGGDPAGGADFRLVASNI